MFALSCPRAVESRDILISLGANYEKIYRARRIVGGMLIAAGL